MEEVDGLDEVECDPASRARRRDRQAPAGIAPSASDADIRTIAKPFTADTSSDTLGAVLA